MKPSTKVTVASVQPFAPLAASETPLMQRAAWRSADEAAARGARLVVFPEYFNVMGLEPADACRASAQAEDFRQRAASWCRNQQAWLLLPVIEQRGSGRYNAAHLFDPDGQCVATYHKTHLTSTEKAAYGLTAGDDISTVDTPLGTIGVMICYDIYFPEVARLLFLKGVELILFPSLQRSDREASCMLLNRARAMDTAAYLIRSSYGQRAGATFCPDKMFGGSCIIAPDGEVLSDAGHYEGFALADIEPKTPWKRQRCHGMPPQSVREFLIEDRRPDLYRPLARD